MIFGNEKQKEGTQEKEYEVTVTPEKPYSAEQFETDIQRLQTEIILPEYQTKPLTVKRHTYNFLKKSGYVTVILEEGKNREIRRLFL